MTELIFNHFQENSSTYNYLFTSLGRTAIGTVLMGLSLCCIYLLYFLCSIYKMPRTSRQYQQMSDHLATQSLLRYLITVFCILTITTLIFLYFEWGPQYLSLGFAVCACIVIAKWMMDQINNSGRPKKE